MQSINQILAIDVKDWVRDPSYFMYPEGARPKRAYFPPKTCDFSFILPDRRYLFKSSSNAPQDQFWAEIVAYKIGCLLGLEVPPAYAAYDSSTKTCGALIEWFYRDEEIRFFHGGDLFKSIIPDFDSTRGKQHNLETIERFFSALVLRSKRKDAKLVLKTDPIKYWGETFIFDALIGNTDRHQNNWGLLISNKDGIYNYSLSPLFDNGTSLGSERYVHIMKQWTKDRFHSYINQGAHHMKITLNDNDRPLHIEMINHYITKHPDIKKYLYDIIAAFSFEEFESELRRLSEIEMPVSLSDDRINFYLKLTKIRYERLMDVFR